MDSKYEMIIYWSEEDNAFVVEVPELPGCMADGPTYGEAVTNAQVIVDEWLETAAELGRPIPETATPVSSFHGPDDLSFLSRAL